MAKPYITKDSSGFPTIHFPDIVENKNNYFTHNWCLAYSQANTNGSGTFIRKNNPAHTMFIGTKNHTVYNKHPIPSDTVYSDAEIKKMVESGQTSDAIMNSVVVDSFLNTKVYLTLESGANENDGIKDTQQYYMFTW